MAEHAGEFGIRPDLITIGGGSAGADLAAALALKVRDESGPRIALQLLEAPALDLTFGPDWREEVLTVLRRVTTLAAVQ